ncbi:proline--tRNA ligase [Candidatus Fermentibacteria bacterium]|nr:proline--tRNA ligase [Candidatus Fermentibacteria bacterium]
MARVITPRSEDYAQWYVDVVLNAELADYAPVKGCMVIRPNGYGIWEKMQSGLDGLFKDTGHSNAYFPLLIPESFMRKEAEHVEGFSPECAVVTMGGGKPLEEPLYIRPTSETIIWSMYRKWIRSYRDLPLLINQWANVVRWEMRTRLFLRTTEFLWQEGHTAHATHEDSHREALQMLDVYRQFAEEYMAMPVHVGRKTDAEKFPGALVTYCIEALMQDGKSLQAGTSHDLGQNFAKAFDVTYLSPEGVQEYVWATSWGVSTRLVGGLVMTHSDDDGLVIPPRLAPQLAVIVPIYRSDEERTAVLEAAHAAARQFPKAWRTVVDDRDTAKPGRKFTEWELRGVPIRIEIGPRDLAQGQVTVVRRDTKPKTTAPMEGLADHIQQTAEAMQRDLLERARSFRDQNTHSVDSWEEFEEIFRDGSAFVWAHWSGDPEVEAEIKERTKATVRLIPLDGDEEDGRCILSGKPSRTRVLFAKAY